MLNIREHLFWDLVCVYMFWICQCVNDFRVRTYDLDILTTLLCCWVNWPRGYKTFFILNSTEHEILHAQKYKNIKKFGSFSAQISLERYIPRS